MTSSESSVVSSGFTLDAGTLFALGVAFALMPAAQLLTAYALPKETSRRYYYLFLWHAYDLLTHFILEGSFLYHCFYSYVDLPLSSSDYPHPASRTSEPQYLLYNDSSRRYGPKYSQSPMARLWQEYAKADHRWGGADLTVISLELLTVGLAGPAAAYICSVITRIANYPDSSKTGERRACLWFVAIMLATGELYGGFMTFAPEWLSGNTQLAGDDPVYLWLYLVFFNTLWVFVPLWVLYEGYHELKSVFSVAHSSTTSKKRS